MYTKKLSFSKKSRLTSTKEYTSFIKNSHKIITKEIITFIKKNNLNFPRLGIIISKKHIKHACKRNQIKRLIRESFRIHQHFLKKMDFIITIQTKIIILNKESIKQTLHNIWRYKYDANFENTNNINISISNNYQPFTK